MTSNIRATFTLVLTLAFACGNSALAQSGDYMRDLRALERRLAMLEEAVERISNLVTEEAGDTLTFFQEAGKVMRESSLRMDSLSQRMSDLETKQAALGELESRLHALEAKVLELEGKRIVTGGGKADTKPPARGYQKSRRSVESWGNRWMPQEAKRGHGRIRRSRPGDSVYMFTFEAYSEDMRAEIRYYTSRHISPGAIRLPNYLVGALECVRLVDSRALPSLGQ